MKAGFTKDGRIIALDMFVISNNGPYDANGDVPHRDGFVSLLYQRSHAVARSHNADEHAAAERAELARRPAGHRDYGTGHSRKPRANSGSIKSPSVEFNCPEGKAPFVPAVKGKRPYATSAFLKEALGPGGGTV